jgi:dimeric dUTPase (all-alpha-NTP-PPase superfamily)
LDHYIGIESLPSYPINPHLKPSQILLKDFIARITEELGEGHESLRNGVNVFKQSRTGDSVPNDLNYNYYNLYEELSDSLHFFMEVFIYLGITEGYLKEYAHNGHDFSQELGTLEVLYTRAEKYLKWVVFKFNGCSLLDSTTHTDLHVEFIDLKVDPTNYPLIFNYTNAYFLYSHISWESTYHLQLSRNALKNKPWKRTEMVSDNHVLTENIVEAFIHFLALCKLMGLSVDSLYYLYCRKNHINHFRIKSNY